jgi:hypothetical protein
VALFFDFVFFPDMVARPHNHSSPDSDPRTPAHGSVFFLVFFFGLHGTLDLAAVTGAARGWGGGIRGSPSTIPG